MSAETRKLSSRPRLAVLQPPHPPRQAMDKESRNGPPSGSRRGGPQAEASPSQNSVDSSGCITHED